MSFGPLQPMHLFKSTLFVWSLLCVFNTDFSPALRPPRGGSALITGALSRGSMSKRLIVCCDQTSRRADQKRVYRALCKPEDVAKPAISIADNDHWRRAQCVTYQKQVDTSVGERLRSVVFGLELSRDVRACYRPMVPTFYPANRILLFGYMRRTHTRRSGAHFVYNREILPAEHADRFDQAFVTIGSPS